MPICHPIKVWGIWIQFPPSLKLNSAFKRKLITSTCAVPHLFNPRTLIATSRFKLLSCCFERVRGSVWSHASPSDINCWGDINELLTVGQWTNSTYERVINRVHDTAQTNSLHMELQQWSLKIAGCRLPEISLPVRTYIPFHRHPKGYLTQKF